MNSNSRRKTQKRRPEFEFCVVSFELTTHSRYSARVVAPTLDTWVHFEGAAGHRDASIFDKPNDFMLDTEEISPIIYIWYEGGWLSPPVVTTKRFVGG